MRLPYGCYELPVSHTVYIALGTNMGNRPANLRAAMEAMPPAVCPVAESRVFVTPPWGYLDQPDFLNQVIRAETDLSPDDLLVYLKRLERRMGRKKTIRDGPRVIDLDILFYNDQVWESKTVTIPHPRMAGRGFVLLPLADLAPGLKHPVSGLTVSEMLKEADTSGIEVYSGSKEDIP